MFDQSAPLSLIFRLITLLSGITFVDPGSHQSVKKVRKFSADRESFDQLSTLSVTPHSDRHFEQRTFFFFTRTLHANLTL